MTSHSRERKADFVIFFCSKSPLMTESQPRDSLSLLLRVNERLERTL